MYESFFHFSRRPFSASPDPDCYFPAYSVEQARLTLTRCIERSAGPGLLISQAGLGKSLLCQVLARHFADRLAVAVLANARLSTPRALLQAILFELGLPFRDMGEGELRLSLIDHVAPSKGGVDGMLLIVDEAHSLSPRLLEEIRMITNLVRDGQLRARVVLSGGSRLEERFASPKLASFNQRIAARCYLESLTHDETCDYVRAHLTAARAAPDSVFTADALTAIHRAGDGIPRLINQVADHALLLAAAGGQPCIDAAGIDEAWSDLQQLPSAFADKAELQSDTGESGFVEFGSLSDDDGLSATATVATAAVEIGSGDPTEHLDRIERHLSEAEREFDGPQDRDVAQPRPLPPAGDQFDPQAAVLPEVDLVFEEAEDPFAEEFEEEEVIAVRTVPFRQQPSADNCSSQANQPATAAPEDKIADAAERVPEPTPQREAPPEQDKTEMHGFETASDEAPRDEAYAMVDLNFDEETVRDEPESNVAQQRQFAVVPDPDEHGSVAAAEGAEGASSGTPTYDEEVADETPASPDESTSPSEPIPAAHGAPLRYTAATVAMAEGPFVAEQEATAVTVIPLALWTDAVNEAMPADDRDMIVVDDRAPAHPEVAIRSRRSRHDYRRLFAQLRQREA